MFVIQNSKGDGVLTAYLCHQAQLDQRSCTIEKDIRLDIESVWEKLSFYLGILQYENLWEMKTIFEHYMIVT